MFESMVIELLCVVQPNYRSSYQDVLAEMVHTKDGCRVVREFIAHGRSVHMLLHIEHMFSL